METHARQAALADLYQLPGHLLWRSQARVASEVARLLPGRADAHAYAALLALAQIEPQSQQSLASMCGVSGTTMTAVAESLHAIIGHRRRGDPFTVEAGIVRVADALDMEHGRSRVPFEAGRPNIHSLSAAAIDDVRIEPGEDRAVRIEIEMNNSSGIFQVDELLATKLRGSGLEEQIEVVAQIESEHEKRLVPVFRI
jgi:hypothetical protein